MPLDKVIEEAKRAIREYEDHQVSEHTDTESERLQNQEIENQIMPNTLQVEVNEFVKKTSPKHQESPMRKTPKSEKKSDKKSI